MTDDEHRDTVSVAGETPLVASQPEATTVADDGETTIPEAVRDRLGLDTPGRVRFVENDRGEVVVRRVKRPAEIRGDLAADGETPTDILRAERRRDTESLADAVPDGDDE